MSGSIGTHRYSSDLKFAMISMLVLGFIAGAALMIFLKSPM
jgi:hypothetical protein